MEQVQSDAVAAFRRRLRQDYRANGGHVVGAGDGDRGRLGHYAALAVADGVAHRDGLGLARCQSVKGCVGGVYREHACAAQAQPSRHRAGGVCGAYFVSRHATQAQIRSLTNIQIFSATEQVQGYDFACFGGFFRKRSSYRGRVIRGNDCVYFSLEIRCRLDCGDPRSRRGRNGLGK